MVVASIPKDWRSTADVPVSEKLVDQIIGQTKGVEIIKKASRQKRNVLLIGSPGTGKSMLAQGMAELMGVEELEDVLVYQNPNDENTPLVKVVKTYPKEEAKKWQAEHSKWKALREKEAKAKGEKFNEKTFEVPGFGRRIVQQEKMRGKIGGSGMPSMMVLLLIPLILFIVFQALSAPDGKGENIFAALILGLLIMGAAWLFTSSISKRMGSFGEAGSEPKLIVDNTSKKSAPFVDATGSKAGALFGDVRHDPLQTIFPNTVVFKKHESKIIPVLLHDLVDELIKKYPERIERNDSCYEGIVLPDDEFVYVLGCKDNQVKPVRVHCVNRRFYDGKMCSVRKGANRVIVTPEHKVYSNGEYIEAEKLNGSEPFAFYSQPIITRDDIIKTFSEQAQKDAYNYYKFQEIKNENAHFGYKRMAKILGIKPGQTRWWNNARHAPVAARTVERLEKLGLLPFTPESKLAPIAARIIGTTFGDGGVFSTLNGIFLSSSEENSLNEYAQDLIAIFGEGIGNNFERRISGVNNTGMVVWNTNRDVIRFFMALGAPVGRKNKRISFPSWIHSNETFQKEFFGALLGNELCSPKFSEKHFQIDDFAIALAGTYDLRENRLGLLNEVATFLNSYGIKTNSIYENNFRGESFIWKLSISKEIENVLKFSHFIPIRYSKNKEQRINEAIKATLKHKVHSANRLESYQKSKRYILQTLRVSESMLQKIKSEQTQNIDFDGNTIDFSGMIYNVTTESGNLFANGILASNSGGLGTPAHLRVESGAVHRANKGVLYLDEVALLSPKSQQDLLSAMQEKRFSITGQSEMSSGALVRTEAVPCDFVLVAAGNYGDIVKMHPALRSRIRGYGYEVYVEDSMPDSEDNQLKLIQFVAQEVKKDGKIPHFSREAVNEIIEDAKRKAGRKNKLTLKLRELGGLIRAAGDIAREEKAELVTPDHVERARKVATTLEHQLAQQFIAIKKDYKVFVTEGFEVGRVNGLAVLGEGDSGLMLPIVAEVTPASSKAEGKLVATGKLGKIAKEAVQNVSAIIKKHIGKDVSQYDIHVQFLQTYEGVEGDSASISTAVAVLSAMEDIPVDQSIAMTGSLSVRGEVLPVGGITAKIEAAIEGGARAAVIPYANKDDVYLEQRLKNKIKIIPAKTIVEVLEHVLKNHPKKKKLIADMKGI